MLKGVKMKFVDAQIQRIQLGLSSEYGQTRSICVRDDLWWGSGRLKGRQEDKSGVRNKD